jgi:hypothetical protein
MQLPAQEAYGSQPLGSRSVEPVVAVPDARQGIAKFLSGHDFDDHGPIIPRLGGLAQQGSGIRSEVRLMLLKVLEQV